MRRDHCLIACLSLLAFSLPVGCGSGTASSVGPIPAGCSQDANRPNYCGDLIGLYTFAAPTITYRIVGPEQATDIRQRPIAAAFATLGQQTSIREGFEKWAAAMAGTRQIVEVPATDTAAMIDVVVQTPAEFTRAISIEPFGKTETYVFPSGSQFYGRTVIRIPNALDQRIFRRTVLHEIGHAIGLDGHSRHFGDVMFPLATAFDGTVELSEYDRNTVRALYSADGGL